MNLLTSSLFVVNAAGGNGTLVSVIEEPLTRSEYELRGSQLMDSADKAMVEQVGFLVLEQNHFEMAGGEFCGNATRAAAMLIAKSTGESTFDFTVSGFDGQVRAVVAMANEESAYITVIFDGTQVLPQKTSLQSGEEVTVVDLGGIVHVLVSGDLPDDYKEQYESIVTELGLNQRAAVGVVWCKPDIDSVKIKPVVWVRSINTFFYETSCGSGSIASGGAYDKQAVIQPSGQAIVVSIDPSIPTVSLASQMDII